MIQEQLNNLVKDVTKEWKIDIGEVIISNRPDLCDYQWDGCFKLAKILHKNPLEIGNEIVEKIKNHQEYQNLLKKVEFVKPGFINLTLSNQIINDCLKEMNAKDKFGLTPLKKEELYFLDYGGPNIAKPLHVGHLRPAIIGESLKRILNYRGYKTISDVHLGDYGLQIGQVIYGLLEENIKIEDITLNILEDMYPKISKRCKDNKEVLEKCSAITKELQDGNDLYQKYFQKIKEISLKDIKRIYKNLDVDFDLWNGESDAYIDIPRLKSILKPYSKISEGATIIPVKNDLDKKEMPPLLLEKSNGAYLYATTDLASILKREEVKPNYILYVVDARQSLYFEQVFRVAKLGHLTDAKLEHIGFGTMNGTDGKPFKTRNGDMLKLDDLIIKTKETFLSLKEDNNNMNEDDINKIVDSIIKYADLQNNRERDYIFDLEKFSSVVGKTGPYILYTYLRIKKILDKENFTFSISDQIYDEHDRNLRLELLKFQSVIDKAVITRMPSYIADYVYQICVYLNIFYQNNRIEGLNDLNKKQDWLSILSLASKIVKQLLDLLVIQIPTKM